MLAGDEELMQAAAKVQPCSSAFRCSGSPGQPTKACARTMGVPSCRELYVDLNYDPAGQLIIQRRPSAHRPRRRRRARPQGLADELVETSDGSTVDIDFHQHLRPLRRRQFAAVAHAVRAALGGR